MMEAHNLNLGLTIRAYHLSLLWTFALPGSVVALLRTWAPTPKTIPLPPYQDPKFQPYLSTHSQLHLPSISPHLARLIQASISESLDRRNELDLAELA